MKALGGVNAPCAGRICRRCTTRRRKQDLRDDRSERLPARSKKAEALKGVIWNTVKAYAPMLIGRALRGIRRPRRERATKYAAAARERRSPMRRHELAEGDDLPLDQMFVHNLLAADSTQQTMLWCADVLLAAMFSRWRLGRLFKGAGRRRSCWSWRSRWTCAGNPTSEMGHLMYELAPLPEIQATESGEEFERKIESERAYSGEVHGGLRHVHEALRLSGHQGDRRGHAARCYENLPAFFAAAPEPSTPRTTRSGPARTSRAAGGPREAARARERRRARSAKFERLARRSRATEAIARRPSTSSFVARGPTAAPGTGSRAARFVEQGRLERCRAGVRPDRIDQIAQRRAAPDLALAPLIEANLAASAQASSA